MYFLVFLYAQKVMKLFLLFRLGLSGGVCDFLLDILNNVITIYWCVALLRWTGLCVEIIVLVHHKNNYFVFVTVFRFCMYIEQLYVIRWTSPMLHM